MFSFLRGIISREELNKIFGVDTVTKKGNALAMKNLPTHKINYLFDCAINGSSKCATALKTGTTTELPNCL